MWYRIKRFFYNLVHGSSSEPDNTREPEIPTSVDPLPEDNPETETHEDIGETPEKDTVDDGSGGAPDFHYLWDTCTIDSNVMGLAREYADQIKKYKGRYIEVAKIIGCPWWFIGLLHYRESSLSFKGVLHNGEKILGTGKKTRLEPKHRGPFETWEEAAIDVLKIKNYHKETSWTIYECLVRAESFNGLGYRRKVGDTGRVEYSPYIWAGTNQHDETSKYVSDGKYDPRAKEGQLGIACIAKAFFLNI